MKRNQWIVATVSLFLAACASAPPPLLPADHNGPPELPAAMPHVDPTDISTERMSEVTRVLASDDFQGRSMGTPGEEKTITYLIQQFHMAGLEPGGENGTWTQTWHTTAGVYIQFTGKKEGDRIVLVAGTGNELLRLSFIEITRDSFTQLYESSHDGGQTWVNPNRVPFVRMK